MNEKLFRSMSKPQTHAWSLEQVEEMAGRLLNQAPAYYPDPWAWAADRAIEYLDARRSACLDALDRSKRRSDTILRLEKEAPLIAAKQAIKVPFDKAIRAITQKGKTAEAIALYRKFLRVRPQDFDFYYDAHTRTEGGKVDRQMQSGVEYMANVPFVMDKSDPEEKKRVDAMLDRYVEIYLVFHKKHYFTGREVELQQQEYKSVKSQLVSAANAENGRNAAKKQLEVAPEQKKKPLQKK